MKKIYLMLCACALAIFCNQVALGASFHRTHKWKTEWPSGICFVEEFSRRSLSDAVTIYVQFDVNKETYDIKNDEIGKIQDICECKKLLFKCDAILQHFPQDAETDKSFRDLKKALADRFLLLAMGEDNLGKLDPKTKSIGDITAMLLAALNVVEAMCLVYEASNEFWFAEGKLEPVNTDVFKDKDNKCYDNWTTWSPVFNKIPEELKTVFLKRFNILWKNFELQKEYSGRSAWWVARKWQMLKEYSGKSALVLKQKAQMLKQKFYSIR